ncbi:MAG: hypothetical protein PHS46_08465 [Candidatus Omnitrophica bacterium]|nr:hypothetical protein [Candidatus Omnitrophota bacterium]
MITLSGKFTWGDVEVAAPVTVPPTFKDSVGAVTCVCFGCIDDTIPVIEFKKLTPCWRYPDIISGVVAFGGTVPVIVEIDFERGALITDNFEAALSVNKFCAFGTELPPSQLKNPDIGSMLFTFLI